ncbi:MAG: MFS transporter [Chloroflexi bacterium]|nr:MFS transporter [Chloroflexota bacterium]
MKRKPIFYGWVIAVASLVWMSISYGTRFSFSVFYPAILDYFGWSRAYTASILSVNLVVYGLTAPVAGVLVDKFGIRKVLIAGGILLLLGTAGASQAREVWQFYLTYGVLTAAGTCMVGFTPTVTILSNWFVRKRGMAMGINGAGVAVAFVWSTFAAYFISRYGWSNAYLVMAAMIAFIVLPLVIFVPRTRPQDMGLLPDGDSEKEAKAEVQAAQRAVVDKKWAATDWTLLRAMKSYRFWAIFSTNLFIFGFGLMLVSTHQVKFLEDVGMGSTLAVAIYGLYGIVYVLGEFCGFLSDRVGREIAFTVGGMVAILGVAILLLTGGTSPAWLLVLYAIAFGLGMGLIGPTSSAVVADIFQGKAFGAIYGFALVGFAVGGFFGPWLGGWIHDVTGSYTIAFILAILSLGAGIASVWIASPRKIRPVVGRRLLAPKQTLGSLERSGQ